VNDGNIRMFLWVGLGLALWLNYETWNKDYAPPPAATAASAGGANAAPSLDAAIPQAAPAGVATPANNGAPPPPLAGNLSATVPAATAPIASVAAAPAASANILHVVTDVLDVDIDLSGGELRRADLLKYPKIKGQSAPVRLFDRDVREGFYALQTGLAPASAGGAAPTHLTAFTAPERLYRLAPGGAQELRVPLTWTNGQGVTVTKTFVFKPGQYRVDLEYRIENRGTEPFTAASYAQILRDDIQPETSMFNVESYSYKGPAYYDNVKYTKLALSDEDNHKLSADIANGWIAGMEHHFVSAVVPDATKTYKYAMKVSGRQYLLSVLGPAQTVAPGADATLTEKLFVGPKMQAQLKETGPELDRVTDYGTLTILSRPLFWLIEKMHELFGNWGWAIIVVTFLLKLAFYPLAETAGKSMAKMRVLAPRMKNLQETYKDDREKLGRAMMELYKTEKVNPAAGCLPILLQMPVFLAFYWVLLESVEMRQAPFMGWIQDLSSRDPFFVLPVLNAVAMYGQFKLNPPPPDPMQAKIFAFMPFVVSATFIFFPAGLVLYWVTSTGLSILQQWNINRRIEAQQAKVKAN
jgi:YidC/Oxa1 family membrane protein insertase